MARLFIGIEIPPDSAAALCALQSGIPGAKWRPRENFHLTLRFIGEADGPLGHDIDSTLGQINAHAFTLRLHGVGSFGHDRPRAVWAGVQKNDALMHLASKVETALQKSGLKPAQRKYMPHVTLAYLKNARPDMVNDFVAAHSNFESADFEVTQFILYESFTGTNTSQYVKRLTYDLITNEYGAEGESVHD